jgi:hypothetical protein
MEDGPTGQDVGVASVSAFIELLQDSTLRDQLPPCPDWPDLN